MCVTNLYADVYPNGRSQDFRQLHLCKYGRPGRPCEELSTVRHPARHIQWNEPTTEYLLAQNHRATSQTPPRSRSRSSHEKSDTSNRRRSTSSSTREERGRHVHSKRRSEIVDPSRIHWKDHIFIVNPPLTPPASPRGFDHSFSTYSSPSHLERPIIADKRTRSCPAQRVSPASTIYEDYSSHRSRSSSRPIVHNHSRSAPHNLYDRRSYLELDDGRHQNQRYHSSERDERIAKLESEIRYSKFVAAQYEDISRRPAVPRSVRR